MPGRLTTHVLDTVHGEPAAGLRIELFVIDDGGRRVIREVVTNADGRLEGPLLEGGDLYAGFYELVFHVGDYFRTRSGRLPAPPFLEQVPVRFGVASPDEHYHVPLLVAPFGYTTYRGS